MAFSNLCNSIFEKSVADYHVTDSVDAPMNNPYELKTIEYYLYLKNWIDAVQWHFEDIIRDPQIEPNAALTLKRRIDKSNQDRTDLVELIDSYFLDKYKDVKPMAEATINTESPAWAIDRLSILALRSITCKRRWNVRILLPNIMLNARLNWISFWNKSKIFRRPLTNCWLILNPEKNI